LADSPAGLAAWVLVRPGFAHWTYGDDPEKSPTKDEVLDDITLYWLADSATSSARLYCENGGRNVVAAAAQRLPISITIFPEDVYRRPETWARRAYRNLIYFHEVDGGGHCPAWERYRTSPIGRHMRQLGRSCSRTCHSVLQQRDTALLALNRGTSEAFYYDHHHAVFLIRFRSAFSFAFSIRRSMAARPSTAGPLQGSVLAVAPCG
jgi:hypothetical protein